MTGNVGLRRALFQLRLEPGDAFFRAQVLICLGENSAPGALGLSAAVVEFVNPVVSLDQFVPVVVDVFHDGVELFPRQARHRPVNELEVVAAMKVVKDVHHSQPMTFDLWSTALIDDAFFFASPWRRLRAIAKAISTVSYRPQGTMGRSLLAPD
jgi:hypothetical protein